MVAFPSSKSPQNGDESAPLSTMHFAPRGTLRRMEKWGGITRRAALRAPPVPEILRFATTKTGCRTAHGTPRSSCAHQTGTAPVPRWIVLRSKAQTNLGHPLQHRCLSF